MVMISLRGNNSRSLVMALPLLHQLSVPLQTKRLPKIIDMTIQGEYPHGDTSVLRSGWM